MDSRLKKKFPALWERFGTVGILVLLLLVIGIFGPPQFLSKNNLMQIAIQSSVTGLIACGEFFAILIAGIDLSVGSVMGLVGMVTARLMVLGNVPWATAVLIGILCGALCGAFNGLMINLTGLHPFVITLGTQSIFRGLVLILSGAKSTYGFSKQFKDCMGGFINGTVPSAVLIMAVVAVLLWLFSSYTICGRNIYAMGGNKEAAWFSGINTKLHTLIVHMICGACFGLAGIVYTARIGSAEPLAGEGYETFAIASAIIGGTSFFGGRGKIPTVVIGSLIIGTINNGLNMLNVGSYYQQIVTGSLIILAVTLDSLVKGKK
ncbi:MAG: D-allose ABC transporter permease [Lachnospiraceae bacterium]|nr:D-allose ABC transporter permease [Lachnospiraceae bacterium]